MTAAGTSVQELAETFGTPFYRYDLRELDAAHARLTLALPLPHTLYYSLKANPHPRIAERLRAQGCWAEVTSEVELETALAAGCPPAHCMVGGPGKTTALLDFALAHGVRDFSAESDGDLHRIGAAAARADTTAHCLLRINPDRTSTQAALTMAGLASQFGVDAAAVRADPGRYTHVPNAQLTGLHLYMGTGLDTTDALLAEFETALTTAAALAAVGLPLERLNLGGGFGAPYARAAVPSHFPGLRPQLTALLGEYAPGWTEGRPEIVFESGRCLTAPCGTLVCSVVDTKISKGTAYVVLDAGINQLGGTARARHPPVRIEAYPVTPRPGALTECRLVGPLCSPLDTWHEALALPLPSPGDLFAVPNVGAYGLTAALLGFLSHQPAAEVCVDGDTVVSATRLQLRRNPL